MCEPAVFELVAAMVGQGQVSDAQWFVAQLKATS